MTIAALVFLLAPRTACAQDLADAAERAPVAIHAEPLASAPTLALTPSSPPTLAAPALEPAAAAAAAAAAPGSVGASPLNRFWSGFSLDEPPAQSGLGLESAGAGSDESAASATPPWLKLKDRRLAPALERAVALALSTDAGARAFDGAAEALKGTPIPVEARDLGRNYGEWDYLDGRLRLDRRLFEPGREADLAGTLAHEITHAAQHARGLPSSALELEIEAHLLDLELMRELGLRAPPDTFARQLEEALKKGPAAFTDLLQAAAPGPFLGEQSMSDIVDQLEDDLDEASSKSGPRAQKIARAIARDLDFLRTARGRAAYRDFSRRVRAELKRRADAARR